MGMPIDSGVVFWFLDGDARFPRRRQTIEEFRTIENAFTPPVGEVKTIPHHSAATA